MATKKAVRKKAVSKKTASRNASRVPGKAEASSALSPLNLSVYLGFGVLFGYFLSKARATDYDSIVDMFLCREFQLYGVLLTAVAVTALGLFWFRRIGKISSPDRSPEWKGLKWNPNRIIGAFIFGAGWALAGTCPATALAQIGEGKLVALATVIGIFAGIWTYKKFMRGADSQETVC